MAQPIYKLFQFRYTEAYYELSQEQRNEMLEKLDAAFQKVGGKRIVICDSGWASEQWPVFGLEQFPDIEAVQKYAQALTDLNLPRYLISTSMLGTEVPSS